MPYQGLPRCITHSRLKFLRLGMPEILSPNQHRDLQPSHPQLCHSLPPKTRGSRAPRPQKAAKRHTYRRHRFLSDLLQWYTPTLAYCLPHPQSRTNALMVWLSSTPSILSWTRLLRIQYLLSGCAHLTHHSQPLPWGGICWYATFLWVTKLVGGRSGGGGVGVGGGSYVNILIL